MKNLGILMIVTFASLTSLAEEKRQPAQAAEYQCAASNQALAESTLGNYARRMGKDADSIHPTNNALGKNRVAFEGNIYKDLFQVIIKTNGVGGGGACMFRSVEVISTGKRAD